MAPPVSILLPAFNAASTITAAIESIRAQTFTDWELVVVDDGSTDGTREIVAAMARDERRLRLISRSHAGIVAALNDGLAESRGELVARMDADDICRPDRLEEQVAYLQDRINRDVGVVGCLVEFGGDAKASAGYALHVAWINSLVSPEQIALNRFIESPFAHPSVMFRRELATRHGGYRAGDFPEDYELWLRWSEAGVKMGKVPRVLLEWNDPPGRLSRREPRYDPEEFFRLKAGWIARNLERRRGSRRIFVWGAGRPTRKRAAHLEAHGVAIAGYIDVDPKKVTPAIGGMGVPVIAPKELPAPGEVFVLGYVSSRGARELIRAELRGRGYEEGHDFLMCA